MRFFLLITIFMSMVFAIDRQTLQEKSDQEKTAFLQNFIDSVAVYDDLAKTPTGMKEGESFIIEDEYGAKTLYLVGKEQGSMEEFNHPFFLKLLNKDSGSTFSHLFTSPAGEEYDPNKKSDPKDNPFKAYVSETDAVRIAQVQVSPRADYMEKALNDFLLNNNIEPKSIITMQLIPTPKGEFTMYLFYRP